LVYSGRYCAGGAMAKPSSGQKKGALSARESYEAAIDPSTRSSAMLRAVDVAFLTAQAHLRRLIRSINVFTMYVNTKIY